MDLIKTKDENVGLLPLDVCGVRGGTYSPICQVINA